MEFEDLTSVIIGSCFEVMNELGTGFLESVYKNALVIVLKNKHLNVEIEKSFQIYFREKHIGSYRADIIVENSVIVELKSCSELCSEYKAQVINYLKATNIPIGLLVNFGNRKLEYRRLFHPYGTKNPLSETMEMCEANHGT